MIDIRKILYKLYWSIQAIIAPELRYSQSVYEDVLKEQVSQGCRWIDLGCGHEFLPDWRKEEEKKIS